MNTRHHRLFVHLRNRYDHPVLWVLMGAMAVVGSWLLYKMVTP